VKVNDALSGAALVALGAAVLWHVQGFPPMPGQKFGPAWFPGLIATGLIVCGVLLAATRLRATEAQPWIEWPAWFRRPRAAAGAASVLGGLLAYIFAVDTLGFHVTASLLIFTWSRILGARTWIAAAVALAATVAIHLAFYKLLRVPLPWGLLERFAF